VTSRRPWRRWLLNIHLYGGLLCSGYLLVYGVSSLLFNHRVDRLIGVASSREWSRTIPIPESEATPAEAARLVAKALGIAGRIPGGSIRWEPGREMHFEVVRPGRAFRVRALPDGLATVIEERGRPAMILFGLHDARPAPGSLLLTSWWYYTHLTVAFLLFMTVSGVVHWVSARRAKGAGWSLLLAGAATAVLLTVWLLA